MAFSERTFFENMPVQDMLSLCVYIYVKRDAFSNPEWPTSEQTLQNAMRSSTRTGLPTRKHRIDVAVQVSRLADSCPENRQLLQLPE